MKTVDILIKAREYILSGWRQHAYCNTGEKKTCFCALGAIGMATPGLYPNRLDSVHYPEETKAAQYLGRVVGLNGIASWNDEPGRTVGDIVTAFDLAIKNAKRRHINGDRQKKPSARA